MNKDFWKGKKVFITGHSGFKGSWLSLWLSSLGSSVMGYSLPPPSSPNMFSLINLSDNVESVFGDINNYQNLYNHIKGFQPDIVFHMAAQPLVRYSYDNPLETYNTNVIGTANLLEAIKKIANTRVVINITTDKCYENNDDIRSFAESDPLGGNDPYSSSKACSELVTHAYRNSYFSKTNYPEHRTAIASVRAGNVIGGGDWSKDRIIPDIIKSIEENRPLLIRNPNATRPWQHVLEPLSGYILLAEKLFYDGVNYSEAWNFGPNKDCSISVLDLVKKLDSIWDKKILWEIDNGVHPKESHFLQLDISKAQQKLSWNPVLSIKDTLSLIVDWSEAYKSEKNMKEYSIKQIREYESYAQ